MEDNLINNTFPRKKSDNGTVLFGIPSSPGIVLGRAVIIRQKSVFIQADKIKSNDIGDEINRFRDALNILITDYLTVIEKAAAEPKNIQALLESNLMMLQDEFLFDSVSGLIETGINSENAVVEVLDKLKQNMLNSSDMFLRDRVLEIDQLKHRLISTLRNQKDIIAANRGDIVIAGFITPDEMLHLKEMGVPAVVTEAGGLTSHSAILARNYEISQVIGVKDATLFVNNGDTVIVDGYSGTVVVNPDEDAISTYIEKKRTEELYKEKLGELINLPSETKDGRAIRLKANVNLAEDIDLLQMVGAGGVGLVRTEYLVLSKGRFPDCEEQYQWYKKIAEQIYPSPVTFRVFDVGSDKIAEGLPRHEVNPALGFRGIRFLLERKDIFSAQICAILRASKNRNAQLLLPMITNPAELNKAKVIIEECKQELKSKNIPFDVNLPVGIMVETPAAAIMACQLAQNCDFISIGTNDLTQYTLAADRANEMVGYLYDSFHPAVLKLIKMTVDAAKEYNIPVSVCGELAGHSAATDLLIGLGIDELSVAPSMFLEVKKRIRESDYEKSKNKAEKVLQCKTVEDIKINIKY